jgi:putative MATE family efflux protein
MMLAWMNTPADVMGQALLYMRIYFIGVPASLLYNIASGILRAHGDTKRPMYILMLSGLMNVALNLMFVVLMHMDVAGVALATILSQYMSAIAALWIMLSHKDQYKLTMKEMRIDKVQMLAVIRIGVPSGLGSMVFSASNIVVQTAMNSLNSAAVIAGKAAATDINSLVYQIQAGIYAACVSFAGQCFGAKKYKRIDKVATTATALCVTSMGVCAVLCAIFAPQLVGLFNTDPDVVQYGSIMLRINTLGIIVYVPAEIYLGCSRGMRRAMAPTMLNMIAVCGVRMLWATVVFPLNPTVSMLYYCFPISWAVSSILQIIYYYHIRKKLDKQEIQPT